MVVVIGSTARTWRTALGIPEGRLALALGMTTRELWAYEDSPTTENVRAGDLLRARLEEHVRERGAAGLVEAGIPGLEVYGAAETVKAETTTHQETP